MWAICKFLRQSPFCQKDRTSFRTAYIVIKCYIIIWDIGLNYLNAAFNGYDPVALSKKLTGHIGVGLFVHPPVHQELCMLGF